MIPFPNSLDFLTHQRSNLTENIAPVCWYYPENIVNQCGKGFQNRTLETLPSSPVNDKRGRKQTLELVGWAVGNKLQRL